MFRVESELKINQVLSVLLAHCYFNDKKIKSHRDLVGAPRTYKQLCHFFTSSEL